MVTIIMNQWQEIMHIASSLDLDGGEDCSKWQFSCDMYISLLYSV
jgi:hypothetical protein